MIPKIQQLERELEGIRLAMKATINPECVAELWQQRKIKSEELFYLQTVGNEQYHYRELRR